MKSFFQAIRASRSHEFHAHPLRFWLRELCVVALLLLTALLLIAFAEPVKDESELTQVQGAYAGVDDQNVLYLILPSGEECGFSLDNLSSVEELNLLARTGDAVSLRCEITEYRNVRQLTVNGTEILSLAEGRAAAEKNLRFGRGLTAAAFCGALALLLLRVRRWKKETEVPAPEPRAAVREQAKPLTTAENRERMVADVNRALREKTLREAQYSDDDRKAVERYITEAFGSVSTTVFDGENHLPRIDVAVSEPTPGRKYNTLTTVGMGALPMEGVSNRNAARAELTILLPEGWNMADEAWPFAALRETARRPFEERKPLHPGSVYRLGALAGTGFSAVLVIPTPTNENVPRHLDLPGGKVNFHLLLPLYEEEWVYYNAHGCDLMSFMNLFANRVRSVVVDPSRRSCIGLDELNALKGDL